MSVCYLRFSWCCQPLQTYGSNWFVLTITVTSTHFSTLRMRRICYKFVDRQGPIKTYLKSILFLSCSPSLPRLSMVVACHPRHGSLRVCLHGVVYVMGINFYQEYTCMLRLNNSWAHLLTFFWKFISIPQKGFLGAIFSPPLRDHHTLLLSPVLGHRWYS